MRTVTHTIGRVHKILMTGDNSRTDYDEITAMKRYAIELGVPAGVIHLDYAGYASPEAAPNFLGKYEGIE